MISLYRGCPESRVIAAMCRNEEVAAQVLNQLASWPPYCSDAIARVLETCSRHDQLRGSVAIGLERLDFAVCSAAAARSESFL
jgi:hypothetical protein